MKRFIFLLAALLLLPLLIACNKPADAPAPASAAAASAKSTAAPTAAPTESAKAEPGSICAAVEQSGVWSLSDRYASTYTKMSYTVSYLHGTESILLTVNRSKKATGSSRSVGTSQTVDGVVYALCEDRDKQSGTVTNTYYEAYTGSFQYRIGCENGAGLIEDHLDMDGAIALMASPLSPQGDLQFVRAEWDAYFRTEGCNLEILILPENGSAAVASLDPAFAATQEDGETVYVSDDGCGIAYTDGTGFVHIRQLNRSGNTEQYLTLSECRVILALLAP